MLTWKAQNMDASRTTPFLTFFCRWCGGRGYACQQPLVGRTIFSCFFTYIHAHTTIVQAPVQPKPCFKFSCLFKLGLLVGLCVCFRDAVHTLLDANVAGAPVVDEAGRLVGVLTEADIIWKVGSSGSGGFSAVGNRVCG